MRALALAVIGIVGFATAMLDGQDGSGPKPRRPWVMQHVVELSPPPFLRAAMESYGAGYEGKAPLRGLAADLNRDGTDDYIVQGHREECGTGGCSFRIFNGATAILIGDIGGTAILVRAESTKGFPNIETIGWGGNESGAHQSYVFDGSNYVQRARKDLQGAGYWALIRTWRKYPRWPPAKF